MADMTKRMESDSSRAADYYDIITLPGTDPVFSNELLDFWSPIGWFGGYAEGFDVGLCRIKEPFSEIDRMERHLSSVELIAPINGDLFIPVAPPEESPDPEKARIVPVRVGEIINLPAGVWHFACGSTDALKSGVMKVPLDYFVFLKRGTPTEDLEMKEMGASVGIGL
jgi:hypothetical protein